MGSLSFPEPVYFTNPSPVTSSGQHEQGTELLGVEPPTATNIGSLSFPDLRAALDTARAYGYHGLARINGVFYNTVSIDIFGTKYPYVQIWNCVI